MPKGRLPKTDKKPGGAEVSETLRGPRSMLERLIEIAPQLSCRKIAKGQSIY